MRPSGAASDSPVGSLLLPPSPPALLRRGGASHSSGRKCLEFRFRFREWTEIFFSLSLSPSHQLDFPTKFCFHVPNSELRTVRRTNSTGLNRIRASYRRWLRRHRSPRLPRSLRRPNLLLPERKMTLSWGNLVELWREGKKQKKVKTAC